MGELSVFGHCYLISELLVAFAEEHELSKIVPKSMKELAAESSILKEVYGDQPEYDFTHKKRDVLPIPELEDYVSGSKLLDEKRFECFESFGLVNPKDIRNFKDPNNPGREVLYTCNLHNHTYCQNDQLVLKLTKAIHAFDAEAFLEVADLVLIKKLTNKEKDEFRRIYPILEEKHRILLSEAEIWTRRLSRHNEKEEKGGDK